MKDKIYMIIPLLLILILAIFLVGFILYQNYTLEETNKKLKADTRSYKLEIKKLRKQYIEALVRSD